MSDAILGIDHAVIAVHDLEAAKAVYEKLGFTHVPMGDHQNRATANYCIMFPDTYLELLGVNQPDLPDYGITAFLTERGEGFQRLANGTSDADAIAAHLKANGLEPNGPMLLERPQDYPKGMVTFHNVMIPTEQTNGIWTFFCCHKTPDLMRTPEWLKHANGAVAVLSATAVVEDMDAARAALQKVYGKERVKEAAHGLHIQLPRGKIEVTTPNSFAMVHIGEGTPKGPFPRWYGLQIAVKDVAGTEQYLMAKHIPFEHLPDGTLRLTPDQTCGVLLEFHHA